MPEAVARSRHVRGSARKMRLVADLIRGKTVAEARDILRFTAKDAAPVLAKVLNAAVANAESKAAETRQRLNTDDMVITRLLVDVGGTLRRYRAATRGRGVRIRKRTHHVTMVIAGEAAPQTRKRKGA